MLDPELLHSYRPEDDTVIPARWSEKHGVQVHLDSGAIVGSMCWSGITYEELAEWCDLPLKTVHRCVRDCPGFWAPLWAAKRILGLVAIGQVRFAMPTQASGKGGR